MNDYMISIKEWCLVNGENYEELMNALFEDMEEEKKIDE